MSGDAIDIEAATLKDLMANTYAIRSSLISGLPKWAENEQPDIKAQRDVIFPIR